MRYRQTHQIKFTLKLYILIKFLPTLNIDAIYVLFVCARAATTLKSAMEHKKYFWGFCLPKFPRMSCKTKELKMQNLVVKNNLMILQLLGAQIVNSISESHFHEEINQYWRHRDRLTILKLRQIEFDPYLKFISPYQCLPSNSTRFSLCY